MLTFFVTWFVLVALLLLRNQWVLKLRLWMIDTDLNQYEQMPSYESMLFRPWIWTARGFGWK